MAPSVTVHPMACVNSPNREFKDTVVPSPSLRFVQFQQVLDILPGIAETGYLMLTA